MLKAELKVFIHLVVLTFLISTGSAFGERIPADDPKLQNLTEAGVKIYKPEKCYNGYTLFAPQVSEPAPGTVTNSWIYLIDMEGNIACQWMVENNGSHCQLKRDGNLICNRAPALASTSRLGNLIELDFKSNVTWLHEGFIDHDFQILDDGNLLSGEVEVNIGFRISPLFRIVNRDNKILWEWRGENHVNELERDLGLKFNLAGDWAHNNTCRMLGKNPLAKKDTRFHEKNIIFSYPNLNTVGIIDYHTGKIVWTWGPGNIEKQHTPHMLENGNILIFDNGSERKWSRVIELDPLTKQIAWEYHSDPKEDFYSEIMSNAFRLPNGNTLICESLKGRIFEVTAEGEIVWDYKNTFIVTNTPHEIYRAYRYSPQYVRPLLANLKKWRSQHGYKTR